MPETWKVLNVRVDGTQRQEVLDQIQEKLTQGGKFYITTPNPEIVLKASKDRKLKDIIGQSLIAIPDGVGLPIASKFLNMQKFRSKTIRKLVYPCQLLLCAVIGRDGVVRGRELMLDLFDVANKGKKKVYLLGATKGVNAKALDKFESEYPGAKVRGSSGPIITDIAKPLGRLQEKINRDAINQINKFRPDILIVAFGCPKQEKWIAKWLSRLNVKCAMTVGGALDYYAGVAKLPPKVLSRLGLEWFWRLAREPKKRIKRVVNAIFIFPWTVFKFKLQTQV
ncbi:hypothetical protein A3D84_02025 [Candidatus Woesebacteria bacterium RIFCSPHIGHO2_02_FULL_42_20]|uniref:Uncharacterized protein n=1 Tax=Candidatus Woesebacteria bacterium RIFCSPHIGHO2_12_FULL_41_24 TaxID=1802510 RepID=A0A1F8AU75_9BACT|nr:MAG: hypothetical protein A2W15_04310 [Candidatus Woesebacteria bacterium RBG_16_41_13]OGM30024.1 MAG: hypothetical protein A2873_04860 [Candidatus Woesebacteria bacterium RIFCSPHIGHO2_01_FULL_42_80]OGM35102.1 MAG: hypothetical protein A3D84_02025 [Candidatus Woesebacteria bacterium RIFCSPHIGHO2_02_FULL_42_20]OGM54838.1 MAG: hypothetical protein A3E44_01625 [Candidatus Woesebacteria bacterium RIFCSPHIGHO2_12_FULL_41_24]OGM67454.1 MAG: hypothetical protein A2969_05475 [Candidatus Woesebacteri